MVNKKLKNNGFVAFLLLLIIAIGTLSYQNASEYAELKEVFNLEKEELETELNTVIKDYENAVYIKSDISLNLKNKLHEIIKLKDTINNLKSTDYGLFRTYRKRISRLAEQNKILFNYIDSLNTVNNQLLTKNDSVKEILVAKESQYSKLKSKNKYLNKEKRLLNDRIAVAEIIEISTVKASAMKKRRNGKYTSTSKSSKTDAFKIEFNLKENKFVSPGNKPIYIQIIKNNTIVFPAKEIQLKNKEKIFCNDILSAEYKNKQIAAISFINVNRDDVSKGSYAINVFIDGIFAKKTSLQLK